jgi:hypothetical protein
MIIFGRDKRFELVDTDQMELEGSVTVGGEGEPSNSVITSHGASFRCLRSLWWENKYILSLELIIIIIIIIT